MKVFISWSGDESHAMAQALAEWLRQVIQSLEPFLSSADIQKGVRWFEEIGSQLEQTHFGILCLTADNLTEPWILFEAGALSKNVKKAHVVPLLSGVTPAELTPPLSNFNAATISKEEIKRLVETMNRLVDRPLPESVLAKTFERMWPELEESLQAAKSRGSAMTPSAAKRTTGDMVAETLELVRSIARQQSRDREDSISREMAALAGNADGWWHQGSDPVHLTMGEYLRNESNAQTIAHLVNILARRKMHPSQSEKVQQPMKDENKGTDGTE